MLLLYWRVKQNNTNVKFFFFWDITVHSLIIPVLNKFKAVSDSGQFHIWQDPLKLTQLLQIQQGSPPKLRGTLHLLSNSINSKVQGFSTQATSLAKGSKL